MSRGAHRVASSRLPPSTRRPFSVADELSCYFDAPDEPANVHVEVGVPGRLNLSTLREAAVGALRASPRASARRAAPNPMARSYAWESPADLDFDPVSFRSFSAERDLVAIRNEFIARAPSVNASPPIALLVASGPTGEHLILNAHHASMDGMSCLELLRDVGRLYRRLAGTASTPAVAGHAPGAGRQPPEPVASQPAIAPSMAGSPEPMRQRRLSRPARIAGEASGRRGCEVLIRRLPSVPAVSSGQGGATLNDALITALIITVGRWNAQHGRAAREVRVTVPVNARQAAGRPAAGNHSRLVTIAGAPPAPGQDPAPLLLDVGAQVKRARQVPSRQVDAGSLGIAALWCPAAVKRCLIRTALRVAGPLVCDTVMLTNLGRIGDPPDFGQSGRVSLAFSSSAHMPRGLSVAVVTAAGQPAIAVRYNRALLDADAAERFLGGYLTAIDELTTAQRRGPGASSRSAPVPVLGPPAE